MVACVLVRSCCWLVQGAHWTCGGVLMGPEVWCGVKYYGASKIQGVVPRSPGLLKTRAQGSPDSYWALLFL